MENSNRTREGDWESEKESERKREKLNEEGRSSNDCWLKHTMHKVGNR